MRIEFSSSAAAAQKLRGVSIGDRFRTYSNVLRRIGAERGIHRLAKLLGPALICCRSLANWHSWINVHFQDHGEPEAPLAIHLKPYLGYLRRGIGMRTRILALQSHYDEVASVLQPDIYRAVLSQQRTIIGQIPGRDRMFRVELVQSSVSRCGGEGELTLALSDESGMAYARATFSILRLNPNCRAIVMGGLQGPRQLSPDAREDNQADTADDTVKRDVVSATRSFGGVRPKDAMLFVLQALAAKSGIDEIHCVSNDNHVLFKPHKSIQKVKADYDGYWLERGAEISPIFGFRLPVGAAVPASSANRREAVKTALREIGNALGRGPEAA